MRTHLHPHEKLLNINYSPSACVCMHVIARNFAPNIRIGRYAGYYTSTPLADLCKLEPSTGLRITIGEILSYLCEMAIYRAVEGNHRR